jgi:hypothetical protein
MGATLLPEEYYLLGFMVCSPVKVSEEHTASIFRVEELTEQACSKKSKLSAGKSGLDTLWDGEEAMCEPIRARR